MGSNVANIAVEAISAIIGSLLGGIVVARQCALAAGTQDFSKGYGAPGRDSESGKWLMRLVAHFRHPPMRSLHPRGQESICFRFWREPKMILKLAKTSSESLHTAPL